MLNVLTDISETSKFVTLVGLSSTCSFFNEIVPFELHLELF